MKSSILFFRSSSLFAVHLPRHLRCNTYSSCLVSYVIDDMNRYVDSQSETEFIDDCINYWEDHFDDVVNEVKDYTNSKFKKPMEDRLNEQKTL